MSGTYESCSFCRMPVHRCHALFWDLSDIGVWCGVCNLGKSFVQRAVPFSELFERWIEQVNLLPSSVREVAELDKMLSRRWEGA